MFNRLRVVIAVLLVAASEKFQIFNTIIRRVFINVMHYLASLKVSAQVLFHNKAMFQNVPVNIGERVVFNPYRNVCVIVSTPDFAALPRWNATEFLLRPLDVAGVTKTRPRPCISVPYFRAAPFALLHIHAPIISRLLDAVYWKIQLAHNNPESVGCPHYAVPRPRAIALWMRGSLN
jgi:hypothetical protein